jgi:hypothetical protein
MSERRITEVILAMFLVASWMEIPSVCFGDEFTSPKHYNAELLVFQGITDFRDFIGQPN